MVLHCHGGESRDFRVLKMADTIEKKPSIQILFFDISVNTDQIGMGFEADTPSATFGQRSG